MIVLPLLIQHRHARIHIGHSAVANAKIEEQAKDLMCGACRTGVREKDAMVEGRTYRWDPRTNEFGVKDRATDRIIKARLLAVTMEQYRNVRVDEQPGVRLACPCCGYLTLPSRGWHEICPVCGWNDDGQDDHDADELRGAPNKVSLTDARRNFLKFGASEPRRRPYIRSPREEEYPPPGEQADQSGTE